MADQKQLAILKSGVQTWNAWRRQHSETPVDLFGADLAGADLMRADLIQANLYHANLALAYLSSADLFAANMTGANLTGAKLTGTNLAGAELTGAKLTEAYLNGTSLTGASVHGVDLTKAYLRETVLANLDLSHVSGLDLCRFGGPCTLDHRTLVRSGPLPLGFLRGCGLPDRLIEYLPSLLGSVPIQFYSCFISHATQDRNFADRMHADLQNEGVRCWFAPHDIQAGRKIYDQIDEAIRVYDRLLLILSEHSMNSEWVNTEIAHARQKEINEGQRILFPISLVPFETIKAWKNFDADTGKDTAREIREYFIPDFSQWKDHDHYRYAFERLLRDLKTRSGPAPEPNRTH